MSPPPRKNTPRNDRALRSLRLARSLPVGDDAYTAVPLNFSWCERKKQRVVQRVTRPPNCATRATNVAATPPPPPPTRRRYAANMPRGEMIHVGDDNNNTDPISRQKAPRPPTQRCYAAMPYDDNKNTDPIICQKAMKRHTGPSTDYSWPVPLPKNRDCPPPRREREDRITRPLSLLKPPPTRCPKNDAITSPRPDAYGSYVPGIIISEPQF